MLVPAEEYSVAPLPANEEQRMQAVEALGLLDSAPEERFDAIVRLAAKLFNVPMSYIALVDRERQWFKSRFGIAAEETPRSVAFCSHTILQDEPLLVADAKADPRFAKNPLVTGAPNIGAYAGIPLTGPDNQKVGTFCLADHTARRLSDDEKDVLKELARIVERELSLGGVIRKQDEELRMQALLLESQRELAKEKERSEAFLLSLMPGDVAKELLDTGAVEPRYFHDVTVLFTDFKGFTAASEKLAAEELVALLNRYFSAFDEVVGHYGLEKLKTIGDSYMCVGGLPAETSSHPVDMVLAALELREVMRRFNRESPEFPMEVRVGIHTGPVVAGVVGTRRYAFDIWGETVNFSSRMESSGAPDCINISDRTYARVKDFFACEPRGKVQTKEKKEYDMYFVTGLHPKLDEAGFRKRYRTYFRKELARLPELT